MTSSQPASLAPHAAPARSPSLTTPAVTPAATTASRALDARVLVVDDEAPVRRALARILAAHGFAARTADSGAAALALLQQESFDLVLADVRMPEMSGVDLVPRALAVDPDLAVVMLSGAADATEATRALRHGALDYLAKPIDATSLCGALADALEERRVGMERRRVEHLIGEDVTLRTAEVELENRALRSMTVSVAETLVHAMEAKDVYLLGHSVRVADLAAQVAEELGLDADEVERVRLAGRLHDVGKIGVREAVLNKPGPLTREEVAHVRDHVRLGMGILAPLTYLGPVLEYVHGHHEYLDGSGYPRGLRGEETPLGARILAVCDAYDAMTSRRAYRAPLTQEFTLAQLASDVVAGRLDARAVAALRAVVTRGAAITFLED